MGIAIPPARRPRAAALGRRRFIELASVAGGAAFLGGAFGAAMASPTRLLAAGGTDALLLSCMDYRLANETAFFMNEHGMTNKYDHVILAGATLGVATDKFPAWAQTFWEHLDIAIKLHSVKRVIAVDHRDCGAYKVAFGKDFGKMPEEETEVHAKVMTDFKKLVQQKQPGLGVELLLMFLDGHVEPIDQAVAAGTGDRSAPAAKASH
ncbi:MAG: carbonic anhydrase [Chloroflexota bacterium]